MRLCMPFRAGPPPGSKQSRPAFEARKKLSLHERLDALLDPGMPYLELYNMAPCLVDDPGINAGAATLMTVKKAPGHWRSRRIKSCRWCIACKAPGPGRSQSPLPGSEAGALGYQGPGRDHVDPQFAVARSWAFRNRVQACHVTPFRRGCPATGVLPTAGRGHLWRSGQGDGIRIDAGVAGGQQVSSQSDPLTTRIIAHGPDRGTC